MEKSPLANILERWLPGIRWWPHKYRTKVVIKTMKEVEGFLFTIITDGSNNYFLPLYTSSIDNTLLPSNRKIYLDNKVLYEAEFSPNYLKVISMIDFIDKKIYESSPRYSSIARAEPLTLETSNVVALHSNSFKLIVKGYRRLYKVNIEAVILDGLASRRFNYIPEIYMMFEWHGNPIGVVMSYLKGVDGGYPFYSALKEFLKGNNIAYRLGLAGLLGWEIAELHKTLSSIDTPFFKPEEISVNDLERWCKRIEKYHAEALNALDKLMGLTKYKWIEYYRDIADKHLSILVEKAIDLLKAYNGLKKIRIHQDLHLSQLIYVKNRGFYFIDFEGEPARSDEERLEKDPCLRDLATIIRSFQYLSFSTLMKIKGIKHPHKLADKVIKNGDPSFSWRRRHISSILASYLSGIARSSTMILGLEPTLLIPSAPKLLTPWVIEKGLYELYYEALYRPDNIPIPLTGLLEMKTFLKV